MIKIENVEIVGWNPAIRGMRNPMNSWNKSDSNFGYQVKPDEKHEGMYLVDEVIQIGDEDLKLMKNLSESGTDHRKYMRMILVYLDVTAPLYWWKEADTYKVGTVANSCSTMHKIAAKEFTLDDFSHEHLIGVESTIDGSDMSPLGNLKSTIQMLNKMRDIYLNGGSFITSTSESNEEFSSNDKRIWWQMIQLLPSSYNQRRTWLLNYEVLANMYKSRKNHKLDEWRQFCRWIEALPFSFLITGEEIPTTAQEAH